MQIPLEKLKAVKTVIVHDNCPDGLASAIILHDALPDAKIEFVQYGTEAHKKLVASPGMLFCDFSPHVENFQSFIDAGALVLDHHRTAKPIVDAFGENGAFGDEVTDPGVCGAVLAFEQVWRPFKEVQAPKQAGIAYDFATLAGIRDTWQRQSPRWRDACIQAEALMFFPREFWLQPMPFGAARSLVWEERMALGKLQFEKHEKSTQKAIDAAYRFTTKLGTRVLVFEGLKATSDAAEMLGETVDLVVGFGYKVEEVDGKPTPKMLVSTRSHTTFDCAAQAKFYGGGGHTKAAGFSRELRDVDPNPFTMLSQLINVYEQCLAPTA